MAKSVRKKNAPLRFRRKGCGEALMTPREHSRRYAEEGFAYLAGAFNWGKNPDIPYRYAQSVIDEFETLMSQIYNLLEDGKIIERPGAVVEGDVDFQRFMARAAGSPAG